MKTMLKFNPCHGVCPLYRGWPLLGGSVMGSSTVYQKKFAGSKNLRGNKKKLIECT